MITDINSEDRLVQKTVADYLQNELGWDSVYAWNDESCGPDSTLGRSSERDIILTPDLRSALQRLNPSLPPTAIDEAVRKMTLHDLSRSGLQHNREFYRFVRDGIPVSYRDDKGEIRNVRARVLDFSREDNINNRFLAVRELKIQGLCTPHYNRRADIICFVNGLPLVFIELKSVYVNIRAGYDRNLSDYFDTIPHAFHHNAFLVVSNGDCARFQIIFSESQNEVRHFKDWNFDIRPHRELMKRGFETPDGKRIDVDIAFQNPDHPFRIAIVCAMWLTGFNVESLSTLYIDKPMKAHTLMQAIARTNRIYPGKDCGVIVDYNGVLKSFREALAQYALGDEQGNEGEEIIAPIKDLLKALVQSIEAAEQHLKSLGFDPSRLIGAKGFDRIEAIRDAVDALYTSDEAKRRFEVIARQVFARFKSLLMEPAAFQFAERHDNIETKEKMTKKEREILKQASKGLLKSIVDLLNPMDRWIEKEQTQAEVKIFILDHLYQSLPHPPYSDNDTEMVANRIYDYIWQRSSVGDSLKGSVAA